MKSILLTLAFIATLNLAAQVAGPLSGVNFSNTSIPGSSSSWNNLSNAGGSDDSYASFSNLPASGGFTDYLVVTNFGFNLPAGVIIKGIQVDVECSDPNYRTSDYSVRIVNRGVIGATEMATGTTLEQNDKQLTYGGESELWGDSWNFKHINDSEFGFAISVKRNAADNITAGRIDNISITVYYKLITLPVSLEFFTATKENKSVQLNWKTAAETSMEQYKIERSSNAVNFYQIGTMTSQNQIEASYNFTDKTPLPGIVYYRLKMEGSAGYQKYSPVVSVHFDKHATMSLTPCPWTAGTDLSINNPGKELLRIQFYNANGQIISTVLTSSDKVGTENLSSKSGKFYYNVFNTRSELLGSGTLVIQ